MTSKGQTWRIVRASLVREAHILFDIYSCGEAKAYIATTTITTKSSKGTTKPLIMTQAEDEALATRLQQQYRMEFLQRQSEKQYQQNNSLQWGGRVLASAPSAPPEVEIMYQDDQNDEEYARNLQMQLDREASTTHNIHSFSNNQVTNVGFEVGTKTDKDDAKIAQELQDEELARQYHVKRERPMSTQELQDEDIARQLAYEQEEAARRSMEQEQMYPRRRGWSRRICPLITLAIAITVPLLFVFGVFTKEHFGLDNFGKDWIESDPWGDSIIDGSVNDMIVGEDAVRWRSNGNGLKLQILNALDPKYDQFFEIAVENWDNGYPVDPLTLSIKNGEYDFDCSPLNGVLKVCNGDYGATNWRGLNEVGLNRDRIIVYSTAKLNDFYLDKESDDQKLYTACHEIGHGLGLPHWDTNFNNKGMFLN